MTNGEWDELNEKVVSTIRSCLADEVIYNVKGETTTASIWSNLESLYHMKSLLRWILLKLWLYSLKMKEGTKVSEHLNIFNKYPQLTRKFGHEDGRRRWSGNAIMYLAWDLW